MPPGQADRPRYRHLPVDSAEGGELDARNSGGSRSILPAPLRPENGDLFRRGDTVNDTPLSTPVPAHARSSE